MPSTRIIIALVATAGALVTLAACSSTATGTGAGDGGAVSGSSGNGTKLKSCPDPRSTCTAAENDAYDQCAFSKCDADFARCGGADYKNANFSGPCGPNFTCNEACPCGDTACKARCVAPTIACTDCLKIFVKSCAAKCPLPACGSSGSSGSSGSKTCIDLALCCARIVSASTQSGCESTYQALSGNDAACNSAYASYAPSCP